MQMINRQIFSTDIHQVDDIYMCARRMNKISSVICQPDIESQSVFLEQFQEYHRLRLRINKSRKCYYIHFC